MATKKKSEAPAEIVAPTTESHTYDAIVIGGGHNGLVNGAYLAKAGLRTLILEQRHLVGGAGITEELRPGFSFTTFSYALSLMRPRIVHDLELTKHGYMPLYMATSFAAAGPDGNYERLVFGPDHDDKLREIMRVNPRDADAMNRYEHDIERLVHLIKPLMEEVPINPFSDDPEDLAAVVDFFGRFKGIDKKTFHDLIRLVTGSAADFLADYFEGELLQAYLSCSGIIGTKLGPMSPGSGLVLLYLSLGEHDGSLGSWSFHKGGNGGFTQVLARAAQSFGAEIRLNSHVSSVISSGGKAVGVALADGTEFRAPVVVSALDPRRTFLDLVEPRELPTDLVDAVQRMKFQGSSAKVNFALDGLPQYPGLTGSDHLRGFINLAPSVEYLERAYDEAKYGWYSSRPFLDCSVQSIIDPDMAPPGKHVLSCFVQYAPYHLKKKDGTPGDWDVERDNFGDVVQRTLGEYFPGFDELVLQREVVTPLDIERVTGLTEGNIYAGELFAPQMYLLRPAPGYADYRTPISGYYQCGSGTHPGGCLTGAPGLLASQQILKDLRR